MDWKPNDTAVLAITVSKNGLPVTGLNPVCVLFRQSDGQYYDWAGGWGGVPVTTPMVEGPIGHYATEFDQSVAQPNAWEDYTAVYQEAAGPNRFYQSEHHIYRSTIGESLEVTTAGTVGDALRVIFGMLYDNAMLDETDYDPKGVLTSGRVRLFATPAAAAAATDGAADDADGEWARFTIAAEPEAAPNERFTKNFRMIRVK
jgi:hypothetical protein